MDSTKPFSPNETEENPSPPSHGARTTQKPNRRQRKGAIDYANQHSEDFTFQTVLDNGSYMDLLVCKFCSVPIGARSDRIKEHLMSKRHLRLKSTKAPESQPDISPFIKVRKTGFNHAVMGPSEVAQVTDLKFPPESTGDELTQPEHDKATVTPAASATGDVSPNMTSKDKQSTQNEGTRESESSSYLAVKWNKYGSVYQRAFEHFQINGYFTDVTVVSEGQQISCHKIILSAASDYFFNTLKSTDCQHPVIFLHNIPFWQLEILLNYMYKGHVNIRKDQLGKILKTAAELGIRSLASDASVPQSRVN